MVKPVLFLLLATMPARAVWQHELFGEPGAAYFARTYPRLLGFAEQRFAGAEKLPKGALDFLRTCARGAGTWYAPGPARLARFQLRLSFDRAALRRRLRVRCLPDDRARLRPFTRDPQALGLEFTFGEKSVRVIYADRETESGQNDTLGAFRSTPLPAEARFPLPALAWAPAGGAYRIELAAWVDGLAAPELRRDVEAIHREFGLLADTIVWRPGGPAEVAFP